MDRVAHLSAGELPRRLNRHCNPPPFTETISFTEALNILKHDLCKVFG